MANDFVRRVNEAQKEMADAFREQLRQSGALYYGDVPVDATLEMREFQKFVLHILADLLVRVEDGTKGRGW
jgi:hypothetical protein